MTASLSNPTVFGKAVQTDATTGNAIAAAGDWEVRSGPIQLNSNASSEHTLEISKPFSAAN